MRIIKMGRSTLYLVIPRGRFRVFNVHTHYITKDGLHRDESIGNPIGISCYDSRDRDYLLKFFESRGGKVESMDAIRFCKYIDFPDFPDPQYSQYPPACCLKIERIDNQAFDQIISDLRSLGYHCILDFIEKFRLII